MNTIPAVFVGHGTPMNALVARVQSADGKRRGDEVPPAPVDEDPRRGPSRAAGMSTSGEGRTDSVVAASAGA